MNYATGAKLSKAQVAEARRLHILLLNCNNDPEVFCAFLGLEFVASRKLPSSVYGILDDKRVVVRHGLSKRDQLLTICHEYCHARFHPRADAHYREVNTHMYLKQETQAELFATMVWIPDIPDFCLEAEDFYYVSGLPRPLADLRLHYYLRTGD